MKAGVLAVKTPDQATHCNIFRVICMIRRVARIDKLTATHMKVSWYGRHHGRCTLARHTSGPDEGQVRSGEVDLTQHEPLAVFDRFSGNKEVPPVVYTHAIAKLSMQVGNKRLDQENATHC